MALESPVGEDFLGEFVHGDSSTLPTTSFILPDLKPTRPPKPDEVVGKTQKPPTINAKKKPKKK